MSKNTNLFQSYMTKHLLSEPERSVAIADLWALIVPIQSIQNLTRANFNAAKKLANQFLKELEERNNVLSELGIDKILLLKNFIKTSEELLTMDLDQIMVEITSSGSLFYNCRKSTSNIYFELFFEELSNDFQEAVGNIYENKIQQLTFSGSVSEVMEKMQECIESPYTLEYSLFKPEYEISGSASPAYELQENY